MQRCTWALLLVTHRWDDNRKRGGLVFGQATGDYYIEDIGEGVREYIRTNIKYIMEYIKYIGPDLLFPAGPDLLFPAGPDLLFSSRA